MHPCFHQHSDKRRKKDEKNTKSWSAEPYPNVQHDREEDSNKSTRTNRPPLPRIDEQGINLQPKDLVKEMFRMGEAVRWLGKLKTPSDQRDKSKWCEFQMIMDTRRKTIFP